MATIKHCKLWDDKGIHHLQTGAGFLHPQYDGWLGDSHAESVVRGPHEIEALHMGIVEVIPNNQHYFKLVKLLVGGLEHEFYVSIYWEQ